MRGRIRQEEKPIGLAVVGLPDETPSTLAVRLPACLALCILTLCQSILF